ncbi:MAG: hypothetical protein GYA62_04175 [Bacteroidales bacterium]|nr:hypothetical protein [Bacteroidales bacterium]
MDIKDILKLPSMLKDLSSVKSKLLAVVGNFLQIGEKLKQLQNYTDKLSLDSKTKQSINERIKFLSLRQDDIIKKATSLMPLLDKIEADANVFKGANLSILGLRSIEYVKNIIDNGLKLIKDAKNLIELATTQQKDVDDLEKYINGLTKVGGFTSKLPSLTDITSPISDILKPLATIALVGGGIYLISKFSDSK